MASMFRTEQQPIYLKTTRQTVSLAAQGWLRRIRRIYEFVAQHPSSALRFRATRRADSDPCEHSPDCCPSRFQGIGDLAEHTGGYRNDEAPTGPLESYQNESPTTFCEPEHTDLPASGTACRIRFQSCPQSSSSNRLFLGLASRTFRKGLSALGQRQNPSTRFGMNCTPIPFLGGISKRAHTAYMSEPGTSSFSALSIPVRRLAFWANSRLSGLSGNPGVFAFLALKLREDNFHAHSITISNV